MFDIDEYMKKAERPQVVLYGMNGCAYGMDMLKVSRPTVHDVKRVCRDHANGIVTFTDTFSLSTKIFCEVYKAELYYDGQLVGMRVFPPITLCLGDSIELTFNVNIYSNGVVLV